MHVAQVYVFDDAELAGSCATGWPEPIAPVELSGASLRLWRGEASASAECLVLRRRRHMRATLLSSQRTCEGEGEAQDRWSAQTPGEHMIDGNGGIGLSRYRAGVRCIQLMSRMDPEGVVISEWCRSPSPRSRKPAWSLAAMSGDGRRRSVVGLVGWRRGARRSNKFCVCAMLQRHCVSRVLVGDGREMKEMRALGGLHVELEGDEAGRARTRLRNDGATAGRGRMSRAPAQAVTETR
jgi:hypothetical protein